MLFYIFSFPALIFAEEKNKDDSPLLLIPQIEYVKSSDLTKVLPAGPDKLYENLIPTIKTLKKVTVDEIVQYFKGYDVSQIEIWVTGQAESGALIVSFQAGAGIKVVLKPQKNETE